MFVASLCLFATLFFLTYYLQRTLDYSPLVTGLAFLPMSAGLAVAANVATIVLMPRVGPRPVVTVGLLVSAGAMAWLAQLGTHTGYAAGVLGPIMVIGIGLGMVVAPAINTGTFGVAPQDAGVASATVTIGQQLGASIGTSLLNTIFASAIASYLVAHASSAKLIGHLALNQLGASHGYDTAFWWSSAIAAGGAIAGGLLLRPGPLAGKTTSGPPGPSTDARTPSLVPGQPALPATSINTAGLSNRLEFRGEPGYGHRINRPFGPRARPPRRCTVGASFADSGGGPCVVVHGYAVPVEA